MDYCKGLWKHSQQLHLQWFDSTGSCSTTLSRGFLEQLHVTLGLSRVCLLSLFRADPWPLGAIRLVFRTLTQKWESLWPALVLGVLMAGSFAQGILKTHCPPRASCCFSRGPLNSYKWPWMSVFTDPFPLSPGAFTERFLGTTSRTSPSVSAPFPRWPKGCIWREWAIQVTLKTC